MIFFDSFPSKSTQTSNFMKICQVGVLFQGDGRADGGTDRKTWRSL